MHTEYTVLMSTVLDHEASAGEAARLHEHLAGCAACAQTWNRWRSMDRYLASAPRLAAPPGFVVQVAARIEAQRERARRRRFVRSGLLLAWAGIAALLWLIILGAAVYGYSHPVEIGQLASGGSHLLSGLVWLFRTFQAFVADVGSWRVVLGLVFYLGVTAVFLAAWIWLLGRKSAWFRSVLPAGATESIARG